LKVILHSRADDVVPFADSEELLRNSGLPATALVGVGNDHRLADPEESPFPHPGRAGGCGSNLPVRAAESACPARCWPPAGNGSKGALNSNLRETARKKPENRAETAISHFSSPYCRIEAVWR
jgi:hypothetical protein